MQTPIEAIFEQRLKDRHAVYERLAAGPAVGDRSEPSVANESEMPPMPPPLVVADPAIIMGEPAIAGTRIAVELILEKLAAGESIERILEAHPPLTRPAVQAAWAFAVQTRQPDERSAARRYLNLASAYPNSKVKAMRFDEVLELIEHLPEEDRDSLVCLLQQRQAAGRRAALVRGIAEARDEWRDGQAREATPAEIMREILS
jgi:uncharacterized protein (DUF433 family)